MRNALASPFVLGVSGGGSLGAVVAIVLGADTVALFGASVSTRPVFAFAGCLAALVTIWAIASRRGRLVPQTLLLAGVVVNAFFLAVLGFINYVATPHQSKEILRWLMGGLSYGQSLGPVLLSGALGVVGVVWLTSMGRHLNVLTLGSEAAARLGVAVTRTRRTVFVVASILTGGAVALAGPVGFVGLFIPHGVRLLFGPDHRFLLPGSFLAGGAFLVLADAFARLLSGPSEMPVGLITAAVGAPCFVILLLRMPSYGEEAA
jgi:iron complex transport system permease protein